MFEPTDSDPAQSVKNGIGPDAEQTAFGPIGAHRLWAKGWINQIISFGFRDISGITSDRYEFTHAAMIELESNRHAMACAKCLTGECLRTSHNDDGSSSK